jgi:hypothetical protein
MYVLRRAKEIKMSNRAVRLCFLLATVGVVSSFSACGQQNTARQTAIAQNDADTDAKYQDLAPADGTFTGNIVLSSSKQTFAMTIQLQRVYETTKSPDSQDPSDSIKIPKLGGNISFPALTATNGLTGDYQFGELFDAMGLHSSVFIDYGDYDPTDNSLILPYTISELSTDYGQLSGTLINGHFSGSWFSKGSTLGTVGTFELDKLGSQGS